MHSRDVCHLDLSLENLLMDEHDILKICDFGLARYMTHTQSTSNETRNNNNNNIHQFAPYPGVAKTKPGKLVSKFQTKCKIYNLFNSFVHICYVPVHIFIC